MALAIFGRVCCHGACREYLRVWMDRQEPVGAAAKGDRHGLQERLGNGPVEGPKLWRGWGGQNEAAMAVRWRSASSSSVKPLVSPPNYAMSDVWGIRET